ncbi:MAG: hypothetical protein E7052_05485 [Lentisphaerae bacterium]|nr:hypothetical protein [Lentisphaerota bacterium]
MNELYGNPEKTKRGSKRRWIYLTAAMVVLAVLLLLPKAKTVRFSLVVHPGNPVEMVLNLPEDCVLDKVYLRSSSHVPRQGKLFELKAGGKLFEVAELAKLTPGEADSDNNYTRNLLDVPWKSLFDGRTLTVSCHNINSQIQQYDMELVFEVSGSPETVKEWHNLVKLRHLDGIIIPEDKLKPQADSTVK